MKAALFDLDGVIVDSEGAYTVFWSSIGRDYGCPPTFAYDIKGTNLTDILNRFSSDKDRTEICRKIHEYEQVIKYPIFPGVIDFLYELRNNGYKTALYTSSDNTKMSFLERQHPTLLPLFDAVVTGSMVTESKPNPEGYLAAAHLVGCDIRDCYIFEDSFQGIEAGRRSGAKVIGVATTNPVDSLKGKADKVIENFIGFDVVEMLKV